jgi:hypothetical protein
MIIDISRRHDMKEKARAILAIAAVGALVFCGLRQEEATVQPAPKPRRRAAP